MFPLGSVLFPHMPLHLRVFEPRYAVMLAEIVRAGAPRFGVVLIERGQEVGGGEHRFGYGTVAEITDLKPHDDLLLLAARGTRRLQVTAWLEDAPYPRAEVEQMPELEWSDDHAALRTRAEQVVRRSLAVASEFQESVWPVDIELAADPLTCAWQLAGIAPLSAIDQIRLLRVESVEQLLTEVIEYSSQAADALTATWPDPPPD